MEVRVSKIFSLGVAAAAAAALLATPAAAVTTITFAQAFQALPGTPVVHTGGSGGATMTASAPAIFNILDFGPVGIYGITSMTISATSTAVIADTGPQFEQEGWAGTISFLDGATNVLTVAFAGGILNVKKPVGGSQSASLIVAGNCPGTLCYTSDVLTGPALAVADLSINNFALSLSGLTAPYTAAGGDFQASVTGTFAGAVPEPATWAVLIAGFGMIGFAARRRRKGMAIA
jgi:hypothetical protein